MPLFHYKAYDKQTRREVADSISAGSQVEAITALKKKGLMPIEVRELRSPVAKLVAAGSNQRLAFAFAGNRGVKPAQVTVFTRQLSTLQDAGLPLVQSMQILTDMQRPGGFRSALTTVTTEIQSGNMLSAAMAQHPRIWDRLYTNLVHAGETSGALDAILRRLAEFREKALRLQKKIIGALVYPTAVMTIAAGILSFIMVVIVPRFEQIFLDLGLQLPPLTMFLIGISRFMADWWWALMLVVVAAAVGIKALRKTAAGNNAIDRAALSLPVIGNVIKKSAVARFTRTLGTLVTSGVNFLDALEITRNATPNVVVRNAISAVRDSVKEGESIHEPLRRSGVFDDIVVNMIKVGEETGELDKMLNKIADNYDEEVDSAVAAMMALMEPLLIIFLGGAVGFIVIALFLPLITLINGINGQSAG